MFHRAFLGPTSSRSSPTYGHLSEAWQPSGSSGLDTWGEHVLEKTSGHCWPSTGLFLHMLTCPPSMSCLVKRTHFSPYFPEAGTCREQRSD